MPSLPHPKARGPAIARALLCSITVLSSAACGGGTGDAPQRVARAEPTAWPQRPAGTDSLPGTPTTAPIAGSALALDTLQTRAGDVLRFVGKTPHCGSGFTSGGALAMAAAVTIAGDGGATYSAADLARWRTRADSGPFIASDDFRPGSPGDWTRIRSAAARFARDGEVDLTEATRARHGNLARDAAFVARITGDAALADAVRSYLVGAVGAASNDFSTLCYRALDGSAPAGDAWFVQAVWTYRLALTYDVIRPKVDEASRLKIENWLRLQAYFFAGQIDRDLAALFPKRLDGDYGVRGWNASPDTVDPYFAKRVDTNGDCLVDGKDEASAQPIYAYLEPSGKFGPRLSYVSQYYNNRRADLVNAFGTIGLMLGDEVLIDRAHRYFMEWLTWAVYPDGIDGEMARSGEYCVVKQGLIYAQGNIQPALHFAHRLRVARGDARLLNFSTTDGIWGSATPPGGQAKSLALVVDTALKLVNGEITWYLPEPWRHQQQPRAQTLLAKIDSRYMGQGGVAHSFHELGLLLAADSLPGLPISSILLRDPAATSLAFPGQAGSRVDTGLGDWSDVKAAIPGVYFWSAS